MLTEQKHAGGFILSLAAGNRSLDNITLLTGNAVAAGEVLGKITASGKYVPVDPAAEDGSEIAAAVAFDEIDATGGDQVAAAVTRDAEVNGHELVWPSGLSAPNKTAAIAELAARGIVVR